MSTEHNRAFNNQISNEPDVYFKTQELKKKIVAQLNGKPVKEQEVIIETLLKLLDVNLLTALTMAYNVAPAEERKV